MAPRNLGEAVRRPLIEVRIGDNNQNQVDRDELPPEGKKTVPFDSSTV